MAEEKQKPVEEKEQATKNIEKKVEKKKEKDSHRDKPIPGRKKKLVENLKDLIDKSKTVLVASIKNLPASQFQEICKKLRGKAVVRVPKKNLIFRAIEDSSYKEVKKLEAKFDGGVAILFSDLDAFDLASDLLQSKTAAKAKPGQEAPEDILIKAGPTDLVPGPAISELGAAGIPIEIKEGKIHIKIDKVLVPKGEVIKQEVADVMSKLDIKPFSVGFVPLAAFDSEKKKFYPEINIDVEGTLADLKSAYRKALPFAVEIGYASQDTISFILQKAERSAKAMENFTGKEVEEEKSEESGEEKKEETAKEENAEKEPAQETKQEEAIEGKKETVQTPETKSGEEK